MVAGAARSYIPGMTLDLTDDEAAALTKHLRQALDEARYPLAPRLDPLKAVLAELEPPARQPERLPPLKPGTRPSGAPDTRDRCRIDAEPRG